MTALASPTATIAPELDALLADHGARWDITRSTDHGGAPGAFHAVRLDPRPSLQGLSADTAEGLRFTIECAEAMPR